MLNLIDHLERRICLAVITGNVYHDNNYDGIRQSSDPLYNNGVAYVDLDHDGSYTPGDPAAAITSGSTFSINFDAPSDGYYPVSVVGYSSDVRYIGTNDALSKQVYVTTAGGGNAGAMPVCQASFVEAGLYNDENGNNVYEISSGDSLAPDARLYIDRNNNGKLDAGEQSAAPVTLSTQQYNAAVVYFKPGTVTVRAKFPNWYTPSTSYVNGALTRTYNSGDSISGSYFAYASTVITGTTYTDTNRNGVFDANEPIVQNRLVYADENHNDRFDAGEPETVSGYDGAYHLPVPAGVHTVRQELTEFPAAPNSQSYTVNASGPGRFVGGDFASPPNVTLITGRVFEDVNGNGVQDTGETAPPVNVASIVAYVDYNNDGHRDYFEPSSTIAADGTFSIDNILTTTATLRLDGTTLYGGLAPTTASSISGIPLTLDRGTTFVATPFGVQSRSQVSGRVFNDYNANGKFESTSDSAVTGAVVYVDSNNNGVLDSDEQSATTLSAVSNLYRLWLPAGTYTLRQQLPNGYVQTSPATNPPFTLVVPNDGTAVANIDFGRYTTDTSYGTITGSAFNDIDGDGHFGTGEANTAFSLGGIAAYVDLNNDSAYTVGEPSATLSSTNVYTFRRVARGNYTVRFISLSSGSVVRQTTDAVTAVSVSGQVTNASSVVGLQQLPTYQVVVNAFNDINGNGIRDTIEQPLAGRTIYADYNDNGVIDAGEPSVVTTSNQWGASLWLPKGTFVLRQLLPSGVVQTARSTTSTNSTNTFVADGTVRVTEDLGDVSTPEFRFGSQPTWLILSADAVYQLTSSQLTITAGSVTLTKDIAILGNMGLAVASTANVTLQSSEHVYYFTVQDTARLTLAAGGGKVLSVQNLAIGANATIDLNDNSLVYEYLSPSNQAATVRSSILRGRSGGAWTGLTSTTAKNAAGANTTLGYMEASDYKAIYGASATFDGETIDTTAVLVKYTLYGDANFDRQVNFNDFLSLQANFGKSGTTTAGADFDYSGTTDFNDFLLLQANFGNVLAASGAVVKTDAGPLPVILPPVAKPPAPKPPVVDPPVPPPAKTASISGTAFGDVNRNGKYDKGDIIAPGRTVWLDFDNDGIKDANEPSTVTDSKGNYTFKNLTAGKYRVRRVFPTGYVESTPAKYVTLSKGQAVGGVYIGSRAK